MLGLLSYDFLNLLSGMLGLLSYDFLNLLSNINPNEDLDPSESMRFDPLSPEYIYVLNLCFRRELSLYYPSLTFLRMSFSKSIAF